MSMNEAESSPVGATTFSITTFRVTTLSLKGSQLTLCITVLCHYAECGILFIFMLNVYYAECRGAPL
jgi:hypothetical protein